MNLNHLAIFHEVAQTNNISAGAERLHISQPAVSKQLRELERALGASLFDRLPRGVRLTEAGELLAGYARRLFTLETEAETALAELRGLEKGRLIVGASMTIGGYLLPDIVVEFHRRYPGIELYLETANSEDIQHRLLEGTLDVGLTEGLHQHPELDETVFYEDELVVIAPPNHALLREAGITALRISQEPFVMREFGSGTREVVENAFSSRGVVLKPTISLGNIEAIKRAVAAGLGLAMVSSLTIALERESGKLAVLPVSDMTVHRPFHRQQQRGRYQSHAARAFARVLQEHFKDRLP